MSITISNCNQICKSPLNKSPSKMLYTFSKEPRFFKHRQIICDKLYDIKGKGSFRATSFGFGKKYDFTKDASCSPPSNSYTLEDYFRKNVKKGFGFGKGRQEMEITGPFQGYKKNKNPGPGAYVLPTMLDKNGFVIRSKLNSSEKAKTQVPGPGSYPASFGISDKGKYYLAKHKSVYALNFSKSLGRCKTSNQKIPGPGAYDLHGLDLSPKGRYVSSKMGNCPSRSFHGPARKFFGEKTNTPCPGDYRLPNEFGYYEARQVDKRKQGHNETDKSQKTMDKENLSIKRQKPTA